MIRIFLLTCLMAISLFNNCHGDTVVWNGRLDSNGTPTTLIPLLMNHNYQIRVSGIMNLGKWIQQREQLANDACFEFNKMGAVGKVESFKNSMGISVCDGKYHSDHHYESAPFIAKQNRIHFWIFDTDYEDNTGAFQVQVIHLE